MPVYFIDNKSGFPDPSEAEPDGLLAVGGDLSPQRLLDAYSAGIFPWFSEGSPVLWWSPHPRMILQPNNFIISKSLKQSLRNRGYMVSADEAFKEVMENCADIPRHGQNGTWITGEMIEAYSKLHDMGFVHSVETWLEGELVGGLYGVSLGKVFFGESMFHKTRDASKVAFYFLVRQLQAWNFQLVDAQQETGHLKRLGAESISREKFLGLLNEALKAPTIQGKWKLNMT